MSQNKEMNDLFKITIEMIINDNFINKNRWALNKDLKFYKNEIKYYDLIISPKETFVSHSNLDNEERRQNIYVDFCRYCIDKNLEASLYATIFNVPKGLAQSNKYFELNSSSYILEDIKKDRIEFIELFRYDAFPKNSHKNNYNLINYLDAEELVVYKKYFLDSLPEKTPHFHFFDRRYVDNKNVGDFTKCNAIDYTSLYRYIEDLANVDIRDISNVLNLDDFGMPYLKIKQNPELYKTNIIKMSTLENVNCAIKKINNSLSGLNPEKEALIGLDAVMYDMKILEYLHKRNFGDGSTAKPNPNDLLAELKAAQKVSGNHSSKILWLENKKGNEK